MELFKKDLLKYDIYQLQSLGKYLGLSIDQSVNNLLDRIATKLVKQYQQGTMNSAKPANLAELAQLIGTRSVMLKRTDRLNLSHKNLQELPSDIGQLTSLTILNISWNKITKLPNSISNLQSLTILNAMSNRIDKLPQSIGQLRSLVSLKLSLNQITTLPDSIGNLTKLTSLYISDNRLTNLPDSIGKLTLLRDLFLDGNKLTHLPASISQLSSLEELMLAGNDLRTLPSNILQLPSLHIIVVNNPNLKIPESMIAQLKLKGVQIQMDEDQIILEPFDKNWHKDCSSDVDYITMDSWSDMAEQDKPKDWVKIYYPDNRVECGSAADYLKYINPNNQFAQWIQNPEATSIGPSGHGGMADLNGPLFYKLPPFDYITNPEILKSGHHLYKAVKIFPNKIRVGSTLPHALTTIGAVHGQEENKSFIYKLVPSN